MQTLAAEFPNDEIAAFAINWQETIPTVQDYIGDTGIRAPILLDNPDVAQGCPYVVPPDTEGLTQHFQLKTGDPAVDPPFPLQVVYDTDGRLAYVSRNHDPAALVAVLRALLDPGP